MFVKSQGALFFPLECTPHEGKDSEFTPENGGWKTSFFGGEGLFSGAMLNFGRVMFDRFSTGLFHSFQVC